MIVAALGFPTCVPFARALDQIRYSKPVMSTPICTFIPEPRTRRRSAEVVYGIVQTLVNKPGPQSSLYLKKGLQYGTTVPDMLWVFSEAPGDAARDREDHECDPVPKLTPRESAPGSRPSGPTILGPPNVACGKVSKAEPAACGNQTNFYEYLGKGSGSSRRAG